MLPKLLMNGIKLESEAPTQKQLAHQQDIRIPQKAKYRCKFCGMLWLDKLALFFQILAIFPAFLVLKHFQKYSLKLQTIQLQTNKKPLAWQCRQKCVQKVKYGCKNCEKDEFGLCWLYIQNFHPFPHFQLINYCQTQLKPPTNCKTLKFTQQNQQGFPGIRNSSRNLLAQNILLKK